MASVNFDDRDEVLHIVERGGEMMDYFIREDAMRRCPFLHSNVKVRSVKLGSGSYGKVYGISSSGSSFGSSSSSSTSTEREYAVKKMKNKTMKIQEHVWQDSPMTLADIAAHKTFSGDLTTNWKFFFALNGDDPQRKLRKGEVWFTASFKAVIPRCLTKKDTKIGVYYYENFPPGLYDGVPLSKRPNPPKVHLSRKFTFPKGSYMCAQETYPEYLIGLLCARLLEDEKCANFIDLFGFSMCASLKTDMKTLTSFPQIFDYTFMEKIDTIVTPEGLAKKGYAGLGVSERMIDSIFIQTVFALSAMQRIVGVQHNDLHLGNVFCVMVRRTPKPIKFRGKDIRLAEYFKYTLSESSGHASYKSLTNIYAPNEGILVKIGDFGLAAKFSDPIVCTDGLIFPIPPWRDDYYDMMYFTAMMFTSYGNRSRLVCNAMMKIVDPYHPPILDSVSNAYATAKKVMATYEKEFYFPNRRPLLCGMRYHPWDFLKDPVLMRDYHVRPRGVPESRIAVLGDLDSSDFHPSFFNGNERPLRDDVDNLGIAIAHIDTPPLPPSLENTP